MMNILLFIHMVIAILLIIVILLQKTSSDGVAGLSGNNNGLVTARSAANFLTKTTIVLATLFFANALVLANLSSKKASKITPVIQEKGQVTQQEQNKPQAQTKGQEQKFQGATDEKSHSTKLPMAK